MKIVIIEPPEGDVVGRELQLGEPEGEFFLAPCGSVSYRHPDDPHSWYVNKDQKAFKASSEALNRYSEEVVLLQTEGDQLSRVGQFEAELTRIEPQRTADRDFWAHIVEQARQGQT